MDCERTVEALIDRAIGRLADDDAARLDAHLRTCARCQAEAADIDRLWRDLGELRATPGPARTQRIAARLRRRSGRRSSGIALLRAAALAALLFGAGWVGRATAPAAATPAPGAGEPTWLLLLHEDPDSRPAPPEVVARYVAWAADLRGEGRLVGAEKLADEPGTWLPGRPEASRVTGMFVVHARDQAEAAEIARSGPHLANGGTIEVRRIETGGGER